MKSFGSDKKCPILFIGSKTAKRYFNTNLFLIPVSLWVIHLKQGVRNVSDDDFHKRVKIANFNFYHFVNQFLSRVSRCEPTM